VSHVIDPEWKKPSPASREVTTGIWHRNLSQIKTTFNNSDKKITAGAYLKHTKASKR
jgi:hypothetical protein